jgi:hypothetical protein
MLSLAALIFFRYWAFNVASSNRDAVVPMDAFQNLFLRKLLERINGEISTRVEHLAAGKVKDHSDYLARVESIKTLRLVADVFCRDIKNELESEDRAAPRPKTPLYG